MGVIATIGRGVRAALQKGKPVAECASGHPIWFEEIAQGDGRCPVEDCPTPDLGLDESGLGEG